MLTVLAAVAKINSKKSMPPLLTILKAVSADLPS